ncbi:MAG: polyphosphate kinase 2 [Myxococcota bacterium]
MLPMEYELTREEALELDALQTELVVLQQRMRKSKERLLVIVEGRDTAGKGGAILRFMRYLDPRRARAVALLKPNERERGQWYFQRHLEHLPTNGEIVFFDRSWYTRAVVEPALGFCTPAEYERFLTQVNDVERMLAEDGMTLVKLWFSIPRDVQAKRLEEREHDPRRSWKLSPVDRVARDHWDDFTSYKERMFATTNTPFAPWSIVDASNRYQSRVEAIRVVLSAMGVRSKSLRIAPDPAVVHSPG